MARRSSKKGGGAQPLDGKSPEELSAMLATLLAEKAAKREKTRKAVAAWREKQKAKKR